ncbi:phosphoesterase [Burkholderia thailandensis]|nr:phosphoesterase [Burkholderia thailandensis]AWY64235.1 phosphoesterase [Burkholderia thailandensis]MUV23553.1 phosphoesterase [Burkholderia thailandensis]NBC93693.1 phosphoesterase [Burkholderia thailandensis]NBD06540.1 phosphoesterase [Burkholderia thailandensis]
MGRRARRPATPPAHKKEKIVAKILENVEHIVVVMFENRSFDTMLGWLYPPGTQPAHVLPARGSPQFDGLKPDMSNPSRAGKTIAVTREATNNVIPDPQETFVNVTSQILGPGGAGNPWPPMQGFVVNYETTRTSDPGHVMQCHSVAQLPTLTALARAYAVSDAWFASVPSQTWPNRAFAHAGTSNGHVNNGAIPDPLEWDVPTIFDVLSSIGASWAVYSDTAVTPSLTHTMFPSLWNDKYADNFERFPDFVAACKNDALPRYAFVEPSFLFEPNDQHPPHDVLAGDKFLHDIWTAISTSPGWPRTLLVVTYDEHGGCFDHVLPPANATPPDAASNPGDETFEFDRFGVRVPAVVVSPYIEAGTVFRSPTNVPYDHTSILATLRDWLAIAPDKMLKSARIANAPTLAQLFTRSVPRGDLPAIAAPSADFVQPPPSAPLNDLQKSLVTGTSRRDGNDPAASVAPIATRQHALDFFTRRATAKPT